MRASINMWAQPVHFPMYPPAEKKTTKWELSCPCIISLLFAKVLAYAQLPKKTHQAEFFAKKVMEFWGRGGMRARAAV